MIPDIFIVYKRKYFCPQMYFHFLKYILPLFLQCSTWEARWCFLSFIESYYSVIEEQILAEILKEWLENMHKTSAPIWNTIKIQFKKEPEYRINLGYWLNLDRTQLMNIYWNTNINILQVCFMELKSLSTNFTEFHIK